MLGGETKAYFLHLHDSLDSYPDEEFKKFDIDLKEELKGNLEKKLKKDLKEELGDKFEEKFEGILAERLEVEFNKLIEEEFEGIRKGRLEEAQKALVAAHRETPKPEDMEECPDARWIRVTDEFVDSLFAAHPLIVRKALSEAKLPLWVSVGG